MTLVVGQILQSRYRVLRQLGQGGMGAVYLAEDLRLAGRQCAVKENIPDPNAIPAALAQIRRQFQAEASILANLDHPNLPKVSDYFSDGGNEYIVMEYVQGEDLASLLARQGGPLPEQQVLAWADQVLDALDYLHSQPRPIIHRDIKPANIILTPQGKVKLVDFGLVKLFDPNNPGTATGMKGIGTPEYTPLEQYASGVGHTDARSDIYALGATLYHLLTGAAPANAPQRSLNPASLAAPRQLAPWLSANTEAAVLRAMAVHPDQRFQTAREMRTTLLAGNVSTATVVATPSALQPGVWRWLLPVLGLLTLGILSWSLLRLEMVPSSVPTPTVAPVAVVPTHIPMAAPTLPTVPALTDMPTADDAATIAAAQHSTRTVEAAQHATQTAVAAYATVTAAAQRTADATTIVAGQRSTRTAEAAQYVAQTAVATYATATAAAQRTADAATIVAGQRSTRTAEAAQYAAQTAVATYATATAAAQRTADAATIVAGQRGTQTAEAARYAAQTAVAMYATATAAAQRTAADAATIVAGQRGTQTAEAARYATQTAVAMYATATAAAQPASVEFWVDSADLQVGQCTMLHWNVQGVSAVYLDGQGVGGVDSRQVCPDITRDYDLSVILRNGRTESHGVHVDVDQGICGQWTVCGEFPLFVPCGSSEAWLPGGFIEVNGQAVGIPNKGWPIGEFWRVFDREIGAPDTGTCGYASVPIFMRISRYVAISGCNVCSR